MSVTTSSGGNPIVARIYAARSHAELQEIYNDWAVAYNTDLAAQDYQAPFHVAQAISKHGSNVHTAFDAGCGTGLSGLALRELVPSIETLDGVDLSPGMLAQARAAGIYASLETADLSMPIDKSDGLYDAVICVGTLTHGHVGPVPALSEFVRIARPGGGLVAATVLDDIWETLGFEKEVERLESEHRVEVLGTESLPYRRTAGVNARVVVLRKR